MKQLFTRKLWLAGLTLLVGYTSFLLALNHGLGPHLTAFLINRSTPNLNNSLRVETVRTDWALRLQLSGLRGTLTTESQTIDLGAETLILETPLPALWFQGRMVAQLHDGWGKSDAITFYGLEVAIDATDLNQTDEATQQIGILKTKAIQLGKVALGDVEAEIWKGVDQISLLHLQASALSGTLSGRIDMITDPSPQLELNAQLNRIHLSDLSPIQPSVFKNARGHGDGTLKASTTEDGNVQFDLKFGVAKGGAIQAPLLESLMQHIPAAARTQALRQAAVGDQPVRFQTAFFQITAEQPDRWKALLLMSLPEYNVNLDLEFEIRLDDAAAIPKLLRLLQKKANDA